MRWTLLILAGTCLPIAAAAQTKTGNLNVTMSISKACEVSGSGTGGLATAVLDFGTTGLLQSAIDADTSTSSSALKVQCNPGVTYSIAFDAGLNPSTPGDTTTRRMKSGTTSYVAYQIYTTSARTTAYGNLGGTGDGTAQAITVYGRVPTQAPPAAGSYADTLVVTVTF
jgi:spore coat protein U-like protein